MANSRTSLSQPHIEALLASLDHRFVRAAMDWVFLEEVAFPLGSI